MSTNAPPQAFGGQRIAGLEKRSDPRIESFISIWCETDSLTSFSRVVNFSRGGLFIEAAYELQKGTLLTLSYQNGEGSFVAAQAEVLWHRSRSAQDTPGMGLRFTDHLLSALLYDLFRLYSDVGKQDIVRAAEKLSPGDSAADDEPAAEWTETH